MDHYHLKSMTAFGRGSSICPYGSCIVEIQSVNRRFLEMNVSLPRFLSRFEVDIRKQISACVGRGMLNVLLTWKTDQEHPVSIVPNLNFARSLKKAWEILARDLEIKEIIPTELLIQEKDLLLYEDAVFDENVYRQVIAHALSDAVDALLSMKRLEGKALAQDLQRRSKLLSAELATIERNSLSATETYRQKLRERLEEILPGKVENEERILREIALFAERVDITEEIVRFKSHLEQLENLINQPPVHALEGRGKTLDFLLQELLREINTIASKAADRVIAQHVVNVKSELEKMREQMQNIE